MGEIANVFDTRYNGTIRYTCKGGEIKVTAERNTVKMYQRLINKTSGSTRKAAYTFNKACDVHITAKVLNPDKYYNRQLNANGSAFTGSWEKRGDHYYLKKGKIYAINTFAVKNGEVYYFDCYGRRQRAFTAAYGRTYYFAPHRVRGWKTIGGKLYYFGTNGKMKTGFFEVGGKTYYAYEDGSLATGKVVIDGVEYIFDTLENGCALLSFGNVPEENSAAVETEAAQEDENAGMGTDIPTANEGGEDPDSGSTLDDGSTTDDGSTAEEGAPLEEPGTGGSTEEPGGLLEGGGGEGGSTEGNTEEENLPGEGTATSGSTEEGNEPADGTAGDADGTGSAENSTVDKGFPAENYPESDNTGNEIL